MIKVLLKELLVYPEASEKYWKSYHRKNNHNVKRHLLSHSMLFVVAIRKRNPKEVVTQGWLASAVIPVHMKDSIREKI